MPSSKTAILEWDLQADKFKLGQWFYGSFYPYRCDISPDGRHLTDIQGESKKLHDFNDMKYERIQAPY